MRRLLDACLTVLRALLARARRPNPVGAGRDAGSRDAPDVDDLSVW
ncbi:hypothetical protein [Lichenibacterium minor]|nr:hypothetical protein [Lichenibacterium minor]